MVIKKDSKNRLFNSVVIVNLYLERFSNELKNNMIDPIANPTFQLHNLVHPFLGNKDMIDISIVSQQKSSRRRFAWCNRDQSARRTWNKRKW